MPTATAGVSFADLIPRGSGAAPDGGLRVAAVDVLAAAAGRVAGVSRVAAAGGPPLVAFLAVVLDPGAHPFDECRQDVPVPLFEYVAGQRGAGSAALVGQDCDLVDEVGVLGPASGYDRADVPDVFAVEPGDDVLEPGPDLLAQFGLAAGGRIPGPGQEVGVADS